MLVFGGVTTGAIAQNVFLFCASQGLAAVVRAWIDQPALVESLGLGSGQRILLAQSVGKKVD